MKIELTPNQETVVNQAVSWFYNSSKQVFEIAGYAGTGKSVVLNEIVRRIGLDESEYLPAAYTGQASIIMRLKGFRTAKSLHSTFYHLVRRKKRTEKGFDDVDTEYNTPKYEYIFLPILPGGIDERVKLIVIDEGYMVPLYMKKDILKHGIKVLVAGDTGQLPPVAGEPAFFTGEGVHYLTQIMRQSQDNPIIYLADRARQGLPIDNGIYGNNLLVIEEDELTNKMIQDIGILICGTNRSRDMFNSAMRSSLGYYTDYPCYGERVICRNNNWHVENQGIALANGLNGMVCSPIDVGSFVQKDLIQFDFLPDLLNTPFTNLRMNYNYLIGSYEERNTIRNSKFQVTKGELFEYAYALTTHLAQGSEYNAGIYYEEFMRSNIQNQLNYTGITRFKNYLIYVKKKRRFI